MKLQQASGENADNKEGVSKPEVESSALRRSATVPAPRASSTRPRISLSTHRENTGADPVVVRPTAHERSKTTFQLSAGVRPDAATILASRRTQSVSNPANAPPPPFSSNLSKSNTAPGRSNMTRSAKSPTTNAGAMPLKNKASLATAGGAAGVSAGGSRAGGDPGAAARSKPLVLPAAPALAQGGGCGLLVSIVYLYSALRSSHEHGFELTSV